MDIREDLFIARPERASLKLHKGHLDGEQKAQMHHHDGCRAHGSLGGSQRRRSQEGQQILENKVSRGAHAHDAQNPRQDLHVQCQHNLVMISMMGHHKYRDSATCHLAAAYDDGIEQDQTVADQTDHFGKVQRIRSQPSQHEPASPTHHQQVEEDATEGGGQRLQRNGLPGVGGKEGANGVGNKYAYDQHDRQPDGTL